MPTLAFPRSERSHHAIRPREPLYHTCEGMLPLQAPCQPAPSHPRAGWTIVPPIPLYHTCEGMLPLQGSCQPLRSLARDGRTMRSVPRVTLYHTLRGLLRLHGSCQPARSLARDRPSHHAIRPLSPCTTLARGCYRCKGHANPHHRTMRSVRPLSPCTTLRAGCYACKRHAKGSHARVNVHESGACALQSLCQPSRHGRTLQGSCHALW
jgi:hypothetical protein